MPEQLWFTANPEPPVRLRQSRRFCGRCTLRRNIRWRRSRNSFAMELLVFVFLLVVFLMLRSRLSVESPGGLAACF